jgi:hypothetical protein
VVKTVPTVSERYRRRVVVWWEALHRRAVASAVASMSSLLFFVVVSTEWPMSGEMTYLAANVDIAAPLVEYGSMYKVDRAPRRGRCAKDAFSCFSVTSMDPDFERHSPPNRPTNLNKNVDIRPKAVVQLLTMVNHVLSLDPV